MPVCTPAPLSEQVKYLETDVRMLSMAVLKTEEVVQLFIDCYDAANHEETMPKDRSVHTKDLKNLLKFIKNV